ncbi:MAG: phytanoyl-CoA dioxygenase family protein, partial [Planctomycetota bacterium]
LVPRDIALNARRAINHHLGSAGLDPEKLSVFAQQSYCPEIRQTPPIGDLYNNAPVQAVIEKLFGTNYLKPITGAQIALRFPMEPGKPPREKLGYHIDGIPNGQNGVPLGEVHNFAALMGVILNDQPTPDRGNFTVWPGSHLKMAAHFREHGYANLAETGTPRIVDEADAVQITGEPGDVVIAHHLLAHGIASNASPDIRYNCFIRLWPAHRDHYSADALVDPWHEWQIG